MSIDALEREQYELRKRLEEIKYEIAKAKRPEWLRDREYSHFSQWAEHAGIEPLTAEADAAFDGWVASRILYDQNLSDKDRLNLPFDYRHEGSKGSLLLVYPKNGANSDGLQREEIMTFVQWTVCARHYHYPASERVPCLLGMCGDFLRNAATERYLEYQARYWAASPTERPQFKDFLEVHLVYGRQKFQKRIYMPKTAALDHRYLDRYQKGEKVEAQFNIWFRDWHDPNVDR